MRLKWFLWRYIVRRAARAHGFIDPIAVISHLRRFAQPAEVSEPIELLRAGVIFHARGLINTKAIQHNLDWVWPYWVNRQFDPLDMSFIPRSFSISHINLTHRNWTAVGIPNCEAIPIVDPRGLITPFFDGWSIDAWIINQDGTSLIPSQSSEVLQRLIIKDEGLSVITKTTTVSMVLETEVEVSTEDNGLTVCHLDFQARSSRIGWLIIALRPYNPEGISFVHEVALTPDRKNWIINEKRCLEFDSQVERHTVSCYHTGDVYFRIPVEKERKKAECTVGLATAAALFKLEPTRPRKIGLKVLLSEDKESTPLFSYDSPRLSWSDSLKGLCLLHLPDQQFQFLYESALRTLILLSPGEVYPGPYTYKRFWFRDAAFILHAMLYVGLCKRVHRILNRFPLKQTHSGFFRSQDGEWDSNGEALWIMHRFCELCGFKPQPLWIEPIRKGGKWIKHKRLSDKIEGFHAGLLPSGFSAEHLGPNDYYYWDNFWGVAGLHAAASMIESIGDTKLADTFRKEADEFMQAIERSLKRSVHIRGHTGISASPYRRMDAGAIGSIVAGYPLGVWESNDTRISSTINYLMDNCFINGAFFQDLIHSGINAYLTLHIAQVLLRSGDNRFFDLVKTIAGLASSTGQWPEAIHPRTGGGCMGDGQHVWAAAEWILMMHNIFIREEKDRLILGSGMVRELLDRNQPLRFGPTPTPYGEISLEITPDSEKIAVSWQASWREQAPVMEIRIPGLKSYVIDKPSPKMRVEIKRL